MAKNKVVYAGETLIDLTGDNVAEADVVSGKLFHLPDGTQGTGSYTVPTETKTAVTNGTVTPSAGKYLSSVTVAIPTYDGSVS